MQTYKKILVSTVLALLVFGGNAMAQSGSRSSQRATANGYQQQQARNIAIRQQQQRYAAIRQQQQQARSRQPERGIVGQIAPPWKVSEWHQLPVETADKMTDKVMAKSTDKMMAKTADKMADKTTDKEMTDKMMVKTGSSLNVDDYKGKVLYLYFFQSWCPGCHKVGFPALQKVSKEFEGDDNVAFVAIQTTFEGHNVNTPDKLKELAKRYDLKIPFGQSAGTSGTPDIMRRYRTGGTPWVVIIDPNGRVVFNDHGIDSNKAIAGIRQLSKSLQKMARSS